jgi:hypothetical protein
MLARSQVMHDVEEPYIDKWTFIGLLLLAATIVLLSYLFRNWPWLLETMMPRVGIV